MNAHPPRDRWPRTRRRRSPSRKEEPMANKSVRVLGWAKARPGKAGELRSLLQGIVAPTRAEPGCRLYELLQSADGDDQLATVSEWEDEAAFQVNLPLPHAQDLLARIGDLTTEPPVIRRYYAVD